MRTCLLVIVVWTGVSLLAGEAGTPQPAGDSGARIATIEKDVAVLRTRQEDHGTWIWWLPFVFMAVAGGLAAISFWASDRRMQTFVRAEAEKQAAETREVLEKERDEWREGMIENVRRERAAQISLVENWRWYFVAHFYQLLTADGAAKEFERFMSMLHAGLAAEQLGDIRQANTLLYGVYDALPKLPVTSLRQEVHRVDYCLAKFSDPSCTERVDLVRKRVEEIIGGKPATGIPEAGVPKVQ